MSNFHNRLSPVSGLSVGMGSSTGKRARGRILKTADLPSSCSQQLPIAPQQGEGLCEPRPQLCGYGEQPAFVYVVWRQSSWLCIHEDNDSDMSGRYCFIPSLPKLLALIPQSEILKPNLASALIQDTYSDIGIPLQRVKQTCFMVPCTTVPNNLSKG